MVRLPAFAKVKFHCDALDTDYEVFTTRPDTLPAATFLAVSAGHPAAGTSRAEVLLLFTESPHLLPLPEPL